MGAEPGGQPEPRPNFTPVLVSVIAGLGHLLLGRARRGLLLFAATSAFWNLALLSWIAPDLPFGRWGLRLGVGVAAGLTLFAMIDVFRFAVYARLRSVRGRRHRLLQQAIDLYLRRQFREARAHLDRVLDIDPGDPAARLYLASLERRAERPARAEHHARKALSAWPTSHFHPEIERELILAREARRGR